MPMTPAHLAVVRALLDEQRTLALAVVVDDAPVIGLLPFAVTAAYRALVVHASPLARHTRGLQHGAPFDALVHEPVIAGVDPLQVKRLTLRGDVVVVDDTSPIHEQARADYLAKFPDAEPIAALPDFRFYLLHVRGGRLVTGFGGAANLTDETLEALRRAPS